MLTASRVSQWRERARTLSTSSIRAVACAATLVATLTAPSLARAQVGHAPDKSPYEDIKLGQTISLSSGWFAFGKDPAGVRPDPSVFGQFRYDAEVGGPTFLYARYTMIPSKRSVLVPGAIKSKLVASTPSVTTHVIDGGLDIGLTGQKTWHHLIPSVMLGVGMVSDFSKADTGSYQFGSKFAITYGLGLRYLRPSGVQVRFDLSNYMWQYQYPDGYFTKATDSTAILHNTKDGSKWKSNWAFTAGVSYPIFR